MTGPRRTPSSRSRLALRFGGLGLLAAGWLALTGCATTIMPGEVGVARSFGKLSETHREPGVIFHSPIGKSFVKVPVRTQNLEIDLDLPAQEGVNVRAAVSILYHVQAEATPDLITEVGADFERALVTPVFRSAAADVTAKYMAKDMHSGERSGIEQAIRDRMMETLEGRGIVVESVLLKSISLPPGLYAAVEEKLEAEQSADRMLFVLEQERREAERRRIEAEGIRDAQRILAEGLSPAILSWRSLEAFEALSESPNTKVILTDGSLPMLVPELAQPTID
jgi:regulator of protease activity HflC (stomatin/prohibitin superfamily)